MTAQMAMLWDYLDTDQEEDSVGYGYSQSSVMWCGHGEGGGTLIRFPHPIRDRDADGSGDGHGWGAFFDFNDEIAGYGESTGWSVGLALPTNRMRGVLLEPRQ